MERVIIIGCGGSGKSTLARTLGELTGLPVVHLDRLYWQEGWVNLTEEAFGVLLRAELEKPRWIIDGDYAGTLPQRLARCDTVIFLDYSRLTCLLGVLRRILTTYGRVRPDLAPGCPERFDPEFLLWVWNWRKKKRTHIIASLEEAKQVRKLILKNRRQTRRFLNALRNEATL